MKLMLCALLTVLAVAALPIFMTAQEGEKPAPAGEAVAPADADKAFLELAGKAVGGEWVDEKGVKDPSAPHGRFTTEWGIGKKLLNSRTYWVTARKAAQIYEGSSYWHPEKKCGAFFSVGAAGQLHDGTIEDKDGLSTYRFRLSSAKGVSDWEQHTKYLDADTMESTVYTKKDGKLVVAHAFKFHRKPVGWELDKEAPAKEPPAKSDAKSGQ